MHFVMIFFIFSNASIAYALCSDFGSFDFVHSHTVLAQANAHNAIDTAYQFYPSALNAEWISNSCEKFIRLSVLNYYFF